MIDVSKAHNLSEASLAVWAIQHGREVAAEYSDPNIKVLARNLDQCGRDFAALVARVAIQAAVGDFDLMKSAQVRMGAAEDEVRTAAVTLVQAIAKVEG